MGIFVWNDRYWQFIDENSDYDKKNFVVIRKLFIRWLKSSDPKGINSAIVKAFEKFGKVESVENVDGSASKSKPDVHEAYVTFDRSEDAYKAFIENRNETKSSEEIITVLPVDTWKVPPVETTEVQLNELSRRIVDVDEMREPNFIFKLDLTRNMLLKVFRSLLHISKPFLNGLDLQYELENEPESSDSESECEESSECSSNDLPKEIERTENLKSTNAENEDHNEIKELQSIQDHEFEKRIAEIVVQNLGSNFEVLTLRKDVITQEMLQWFAPVLKQLHRLVIHTDSNASILYTLHGYCPNVHNMHLDGDEWAGEFDQVPIEKWPSLKELYLNVTTLNDDVNGNEGNKKFQRFVELNPQLTAMQIESVVDLDTLSTIGRTLHDMNTLAIVRNSFGGLNSVLDSISGLKKMCGFKMTALKVEKSDLNALSKCAKRLSRLQQLQLITIFVNCEPKTEQPEDFDHLDEFCITHHNDCECHGPNRILSFQKHDVEIPDESAVLVLIVNTKPPHQSADKTLENDIINAFKKATKLFPNIIETIEFEGKNNHIFMQISSDRE